GRRHANSLHASAALQPICTHCRYAAALGSAAAHQLRDPRTRHRRQNGAWVYIASADRHDHRRDVSRPTHSRDRSAATRRFGADRHAGTADMTRLLPYIITTALMGSVLIGLPAHSATPPPASTAAWQQMLSEARVVRGTFTQRKYLS